MNKYKSKRKSKKKKNTRKYKLKGGNKDKNDRTIDERACKYVSVYGFLRHCKDIKGVYYLTLGDFNSFKIPDEKFILVTHHSDSTLPDDFQEKTKEVLNSPNLIHWFSLNLTKHDNPKLSIIPLGINYHSLYIQDGNQWWGDEETPIKQEEYLINLEKKPFYERDTRIFSNFSHAIDGRRYGTKDRKDALEQIPKDLLIIETPHTKRKDNWKNMSNYAFVVSPLGNGYDCHRTWEALALGCIVIVKTSPIDPLYKDLPVLIVKEWSDINKELLDKIIKEYKNKVFNMDKITIKYWIDLIKNIK